ncbi:GyrI-like domain-containing protein [Paenibacillus tarimensis]
MSNIATFECEVVTREYQLVGQSITANFPSSFPKAAIEVQTEFFQKRRAEVKNALNHNVLLSPYMCNGVVATYFACSEVAEIEDVPAGMIGFKLPSSKYAKISCSNHTIGEGYSRLFDWIGTNGYKQKSSSSSSPIEIFYFDGNPEERVEILIPIEY